MSLSDALSIILPVIKKKKYLIPGLAAFLGYGLISYYLTVVNVYEKSLSIYAEMNGFWYTVASVFFGILLSVSFGLYVSLFKFRLNLVKTPGSKNSVSSFTAAVTGIVVSGCPSCGAPVLSLAGLPLGLLALPFRGVELKILSVILMLAAIYFAAKGIKQNLLCEKNKI
ncbi:hypothetical protein C4569_02065 [Candidatus Parcubacteria bacterium]|nr:MAG: hypothetical protein C4569_02065 [Candidatus Parcubacteria bacterium]